MTATLQDAIAAVRSGETERAQILAAEVIQTNPDDANAWYLLSQLVESDARRAVYLNKVLSLDPGHERARAEYESLPIDASAVLGPVPTPVAEATAAPEPEVELQLETATETADQPEAVPDWLQPLTPEPVPAAVAVPPSVPAPPAPSSTTVQPRRVTPPPPPARRRSNTALTALLVIMALLTVAVLAVLAYLLLA